MVEPSIAPADTDYGRAERRRGCGTRLARTMPAMVAKRPWLDIPWHGPSDQPYRIGDRALKRRLRALALPEYAAAGATAAVLAPLVALRLPGVLAAMRPAEVAPADFAGVAVMPGSAPDGALADLAVELGVRRLLTRVRVGDAGSLADAERLIARLPHADWLVVLQQDRAAVCAPARWREGVRTVLRALAGRVHDWQVGQAVNRTKWGCLHLGDAFALFEAVEGLRAEFPEVRLAGPSLIDFEPLPLLRALLNGRGFRFDAFAALLYVDRRGAPANTQYGWFDLRRKIATLAAVGGLSPRLRPSAPLWITETNWPLAGAGEAAPTAPDLCVSEEDAALYLRAYFQTAYGTGLVARVYWWQLVAAGYGLVDPRGGTLRRRPAFVELQRLLSGRTGLGRSVAGSGEFRAMTTVH